MKQLEGKVISCKMARTVVVEVRRLVRHRLYKKGVTQKTHFAVHDDLGVKEGDRVIFRETRPLSKTKKWKIIKIKTI